jgi:hypothetical protein
MTIKQLQHSESTAKLSTAIKNFHTQHNLFYANTLAYFAEMSLQVSKG